MQYQFPHTIQNKHGEKLTFLRMEGQRVIVENFVQPNAGPPMHVHFFQDESLTVVSGKIGYQIHGQEPQYAGPGETLVFKRGIPHRFWSAGDNVLHCTGWVDPAGNLIFFLTNIYAAIERGKNHQPEMFDGSYLSWRYRREFDMTEIPSFVKKVIMPVTYFIGLLLGKYEKFKTAPQPI
ncbi:MAG: cupin domain-containing protein [Phycisphaerae bacterium]|nr:cupin domain-containing protein [Saprospiraceae bacterium]